ncbi:hypothetical protein CJ739_2529 [Mariniflexile rhizosphaerae]|uniref:hypothetical protein n=1 Tax=unclassified Mariniflexile TaxID=2643887 RepID=UPI000CAD3DEC|nr:hypothetical protein [Mariniflexile sp. TRM1-10]AXP81602.1 hypothetical protein CJ739_2529 [Mariniflexile sp. TRM1-10]PLB17586.1 MAG: hypothetical protein TRG1_3573 [Flavobacteriaceae bacterium FS1-H7996/R]
MLNNNRKSIWESAFDTKTAFAKVISLIVISILLLIFISEKMAKYNDSCISWFEYRKTKKTEVKKEKPIRFEHLDGHYAIYFTNDRVIYFCDYSKKIDNDIMTKKISKAKNSELIRIFNENDVEIDSFVTDWTNWTGWN